MGILGKVKKELSKAGKGKRTFSGKVFELQDFARTSKQANERAEKLKRKGYKVRITYNRYTEEYDIWARR